MSHRDSIVKNYSDDEDEMPPLRDDNEDDRNYDADDEKKVIYRIKELDINTLRPLSVADDGVRYAMIGKPGTGKSSIIKSYMYAKRHIFPVGVFCSGTEDSTQFFGKHVPDLFLHPLSTTLMSSIIRRQKIAKQYLENPWSLFIADDCMSDVSLFNSKESHWLFKNLRHIKLSYILSLQYSIDIKPALRSCIDGTFILRETNEKFRKNLYENYASVIPTYHEFKQLMDQLTGQYCALYVDNRSLSNNVEDCVFYYKADLSRIDPDFKFGAPEFHQYAESRYNKDYIVPF
jgi:hypothetical protein